MKKVFAAVLLSTSLLLTGCTTVVVTEDHSNHMVSENSEFSAADVMFAQMMIPHHQQAVEMGEIAISRALRPEVLELAKQIANEQAPEIELMQSWLKAAGANEHMDHNMGMDGMLTDEEIETLKAASGAEFDRLYLEGMIAHHEGAIAMAEDVVDSKNPEVAKLAAAIIESQTAQIVQMKELLAN